MPIGRISLGTAQLGMPYGIAGSGSLLNDREVTSILQSAVDHGITALDTAPDYGLAEQRVGAFLRQHDLENEISVTTKLPAIGTVEARRLEHIVEQRLISSLQRLRCEFVDVYLIHDFADLKRYQKRLVEALLRQRERGRVLDVGVSVYDPDELELVAEYPDLTVVQHPCNLLDRRLLHSDWLARLRANGTKLQIRSILLQGLLAIPSGDIPERMSDARAAVATLQDVLANLAVSLPEAAVAFAVSLDADRVIVAADSAAQLDALLAGIDIELPDGLDDALETMLAELPRAVYDPRTWPSSR
ncbi:MAG: aldo/keto reductase [Gammaproteobacteria bacterium]|jgi:aryl-alcohol dehydrogenase-like predicted oxidoreductase